MDSSVPSTGPICLIENTEKKEFRVNPEALKILSEISKTVVVVAIVGLRQSGKSYLMNRLAGKSSGFALGYPGESKTKGIWMWCIPHPYNEEHVMVLLDTEGLRDEKKGDHTNDIWILTLAVLLSSTLVYNNMGTLSHAAMEDIDILTEIVDFIKLKSNEEKVDSSNLVQYFPHFVWVVRDMTFKLEIGDCEVSADQYLEKALELKTGVTTYIATYNLPRLCIRKYFPSRKCFTFKCPIKGTNLDKLESLKEEQLNPAFLKECHKFCDHIFNTAPVKTIRGGHMLTGKSFVILVQTYVNAIQNGEVPCMEHAILPIAEVAIKQALNEGLNRFKSQMGSRTILPLDSEEFSSVFRACESDSLKAFMKRCLKDENQTYQRILAEAIEKLYTEFLNMNISASFQTCQALL
ncbi:guanylate-binding protein 1-like, partial [Discoglossus pictus]